MLADETFDIYDEIVSSLPNDYALTYSPLIREGFKFCLKEVNRKHAPIAKGELTFSGVSSDNYPQKRNINRVGYFFDENFLRSVTEGFMEKGIEVVKLELLPAQFKNLLSNKQKEEIEFFDSRLKESFGTSIRSSLENRFYLMNGMVAKYYELLKSSGVDALVFRVYYGLYYFPIIFACKMLGITVIDVQHGINGFKHPCYSKFKRNEVDSPLLPDVFWTWSDMSTKMLTKDSFIEEGARVVEGGNPIYSVPSTVTTDNGAKITYVKGNRILYTHQPKSKGAPVPVDEIKLLYKIKRQKVIIRPHPLHMEEAIEVQALLKKEGVKSKIEDSVKVPINESLAQASVHVTYSSTCALDALNFGIPSVYCSDYIGEVEAEFSTGLLFRIDEVKKEKLEPIPEKAIGYSLGSNDKVSYAISQILSRSKRAEL
ncbi:hypothetical protein HVA01_03500 [Halovibrio variabilis]|uniref:UDP-N-acetylglucosamine 2-epimerase domain-containing protein n=1 Tax=Halovibrio variabilis TaxID=31910 RepID=A0A511UJE7_9GAMM|nr:hypothetical protein [Halovibrio variabilis]GEN26704.1 hypothetical protein HVA01_03500 [Halovibrio variabilis]